jgi:hypothetical protein
MDKFLKIQNFTTSLTAFKEWMNTKYAINVDTIPDMDVKLHLFETMRSVKDEFIGNPNSVELKELNNIALNRLKEVYVDRLKLTTNRDTTVFAGRPLISNLISAPENTGKPRGNERTYDQVLQSRSQPLEQTSLDEPKREDPIPIDIFNQLMSSYQNDVEILTPPPDNPKALYELPINVSSQPSQPSQPSHTNQYTPVKSLNDDHYEERDTNMHPIANKPITESEQTIIEKSFIRTVTDKYIVINGHDRDWGNYTNRFNFKVNFTSTYNNISTIQFTRLILPHDWKSSGSAPAPALLQSSVDLKLSVPYITLHVEEIGDEYDCFNNSSKKATVCFIFDTSFKCPNGRGYIIMKPAQNEIKVYQQSLASLSHMNISIRKPSGALISNVTDTYNIIKLEHEYYNQQYIKVVLDKYFDKSEYNTGDTVVLKGYEIYMPSQAVSGCTSHSDFTDVNTYVNKEEGHEILQLGEANENGFFKYFYVSAPSKFDSTHGKVIVNKCMVDAIKIYNESVTIGTNGNIINTSIQPVIYMTVGVESGKVFRAEPR